MGFNDLDEYLKVNKETWNNKVDIHYESAFYDNDSFNKGRNSLKDIELELLGDVTGKSILHLQCHFGQDTISLSRLGAKATGVDFSEMAIDKAISLANTNKVDTRFILSDVYSLPLVLEEKYDVVFTSYGTIGWLPDLQKWASVVSHFLKPGGIFVFAEFHPLIWMFDNDFTHVEYNYFIDEAIVEHEEGTYADRSKNSRFTTMTWNHSISSVFSALTEKGINVNVLKEFNYSPYNCFSHTEEFSPGKYRIKKFGNKVPMVYAMRGIKLA